MKKIVALVLTFCMLSINTLPVFANSSIKDVSAKYWASREIQNVVNSNIMAVDSSNKFNPEKSITRVEFVQALLKLLSNDNLNIKIGNEFTDINVSDAFYGDVLRSQQLGLVYGYPDKTFKPYKTMLRSEVTSVISHITKDQYTDLSILNQFNDKNEIPSWAVKAYAKTINYGIYVNYPCEKTLEPNRELTRAEAAVILSKLKNKLHIVKSEYVNEKILAVEHLNVSKKAPVNTVNVTNIRNIICKNNLLEVEFSERYWSKLSKTGEYVHFDVEQNIYTQEGTLVLPEGTKLIAEVTEIIPPKKFNKNARVKFNFRQIILPSGQTINISAVPYKDGYLKEGPWMTTGKLAAWTLGLGIIGAGAGTGFAFIPAKAAIGTGLAIGIPVGCGVGLVTGLVTPGLHYRAKCGENVLILLNDDTSIPRCTCDK
ncbi:S-layer homology domain-containing protein [bacterium]|nr:S-layer homology domain-containing protein [bacterium]